MEMEADKADTIRKRRFPYRASSDHLRRFPAFPRDPATVYFYFVMGGGTSRPNVDAYHHQPTHATVYFCSVSGCPAAFSVRVAQVIHSRRCTGPPPAPAASTPVRGPPTATGAAQETNLGRDLRHDPSLAPHKIVRVVRPFQRRDDNELTLREGTMLRVHTDCVVEMAAGDARTRDWPGPWLAGSTVNGTAGIL